MSSKKANKHKKKVKKKSAESSSSFQPNISAETRADNVKNNLENTIIAYDEKLLERSRIQWQFGDWQTLAQLDRDTLQHHPNRAKLALLSAAARLQTGNNVEAKQLLRLARDWGISRKLIVQVLTAGIHNNLGRAAAIAKQEKRAIQHFENAITIGTPGCDVKLLTQARVNEQIAQIGFKDIRDRDITSERTTISIAASQRIVARVKICMESDDIPEAVEREVESQTFSNHELVLFYTEISRQFAVRNDRLTAAHFLQMARDLVAQHDEPLKKQLIKSYLSIGYVDIAVDIAFEISIDTSHLQLNNADKKAIKSRYNKDRQILKSKSEHGHDLLLSYLSAHIKKNVSSSTEKPVVIEIGTTRENVPGQGSTKKIAEFCKKHGLELITVDMDPHNSRMASKMFSEIGVNFQAITMKGEEYLRDYQGTFDFIFLDAYDFDHGGHSELRQSRYRKYLGGPIEKTRCHQMHYDCAKLISSKLAQNGVVCIDDTWLVDGKWTAKGTDAVPYLLQNGFKLLEARNHAVLLAREG